MEAESRSRGRRLRSIIDARHELGDIGHTKIYELIKTRQLTKVNIGRSSFVTQESLDRYVNRLITEAATTEGEEDAEEPTSVEA